MTSAFWAVCTREKQDFCCNEKGTYNAAMEVLLHPFKIVEAAKVMLELIWLHSSKLNKCLATCCLHPSISRLYKGSKPEEKLQIVP
jgi:hypothetical protein